MPDHSSVKPDDVVIELPDREPPQQPGNAIEGNNVVLLLPGTHGREPLEQPLVVRLREALDASNEMILVIEPSGRVLFANQTARHQLDLTDQDSVFGPIEALLGGPHRSEVWDALETDQEWRGDLSATRTDGSTIQLELTLLADGSAGGDVNSLTVIAHDVGEQRALQDALEHRANHDGLTGLANRQHLLRELNALLPDLTARSEAGALLLIDIDEFRTVTNSLGHEAGDRVLIAFAYRLLRTFPNNTLLARVGGDEFAVFWPGDHDIDALADQMDRTTRAPFYVDGAEVHLSVVTGIAITGPENPAVSAEALLREADAATYSAKERGRGTFELFEPQLQANVEDRLSLVQDLRRALRNGELRAHYQPKISLSTGQIVGAEALMRWQTPDGELRGPAAFMDTAEDTGLIIPMGQWMLQHVCEAAAELQAIVPADERFEISINLSVRQLDLPSFADDIEVAVSEAGIDPGLLELEITESALMENVEASADLLNRLKQLGTQIAVDDFGTGYSSMQYLQRLPVDILKVDQTFVAGIESSDGDRAIVSAVVQLAGALGLTSVAEGVETAGQLAELRKLGCTQAQGYYFAKPMPLESLQHLVRTRPRW